MGELARFAGLLELLQLHLVLALLRAILQLLHLHLHLGRDAGRRPPLGTSRSSKSAILIMVPTRFSSFRHP